MGKSLGTLAFLGVFQFTQAQALPSPHKQCWTRVSRIFTLYMVGGGKIARKFPKGCWQYCLMRDPEWQKNMNIREIKIHVYSIRQTANVSGEFLRIENKQLKKVQNDSCGQNYHKTTYFCVEAINGKRKIGGKLGHVVQIHVCRLA